MSETMEKAMPEKSQEVDHASDLNQEHELTNVHSIAAEAVGGQSTADLPPNYFRSLPFLGSFLSVSLAYAASLAGYVMMASSVTPIAKAFGPSNSIIWVMLVVVLAQTVTFTLNGRLSDLFGRRYFFIFGATVAVVGFIVTGTAKSLQTVIGGNFIIGVGTGILQAEPILFGEMIPNEYRFTVLGAAFGGIGPLIAVSPGLAGVFIERVSWRWIYYLGAILSGLSGALQVFFYFPPTFHQLHRQTTKRQMILNFDYGGVIIFSGSLIAFLLGVSWGGQKYAWSSAPVIAPIIIGFVGMVGFCFWESYVPLKEPLMSLYLFKNRNFVCLSMVSSVGAMIFYAVNIIYPQQVAVIWGESPIKAGWLTCAIVGGAITGQILSAVCIKWLSRWVSLKWQLVATVVIFTAFIGGQAKISADDRARPTAFSFISSTMIGLMEVLTMAGAPLMIPAEDLGLANGIEFTIRGILSCVSVSVYSSVLTNKISHYFATEVAPAVIEAGLPVASVPTFLADLGAGNLAAAQKVAGVTPEILQVAGEATLSAYSKAFQAVYLVSLAFGATSIIFALLVDGKAWQEKMTKEVARKLQTPEMPGHSGRHGHTEHA